MLILFICQLIYTKNSKEFSSLLFFNKHYAQTTFGTKMVQKKHFYLASDTIHLFHL